MKKVLSLLFVSILLCLGLVSACGYGDHHDCDLNGKTTIEGKITYPSTDLPEKINVTITCLHNNSQIYTKTIEAEHLKGKYFKYFVEFKASECSIGDLVTVSAVDENGLTGTGQGVVKYNKENHNFRSYYVRGCHKLNLKLHLKSIPMVPEFGLIAGITTVLGAFGAFFLVRRK